MFQRGGKLWKVYGSHAAGQDFSKQWLPVETTVEALRAELRTVPGAERHEDMIVSLYQGLDEIEAEATPPIESPDVYMSLKRDLYLAAADAIQTSLRGLATSLYATEKQEGLAPAVWISEATASSACRLPMAVSGRRCRLPP